MKKKKKQEKEEEKEEEKEKEKEEKEEEEEEEEEEEDNNNKNNNKPRTCLVRIGGDAVDDIRRRCRAASIRRDAVNDARSAGNGGGAHRRQGGSAGRSRHVLDRLRNGRLLRR